MNNIKVIDKLSIKNKTYLLVLLSVIVALVLLFVSKTGLDAIRVEQSNLDFSTSIERYTNNLILEEQEYRLNTNGSVYDIDAANQSYRNALNYVEKIYQTLNKTEDLSESEFLSMNSEKTRQSTDEYTKLYVRAVSILTELNKQANILESEGENITRNIQAYVESKRIEIKQKLSQKTIAKINNGSNIWQYTYVTRLDEKKYRLSSDGEVLNSFKNDYKFMTSEWERLKGLSDQSYEHEKLDHFNAASKKYKKAMMRWVELNTQLVAEVLPKMKELGDSVIANAIQSAKLSVKQMSDKRNSIALTLIIVSIFTIIVGIIIGSMIARSISSPLEELKEHALAISEGEYESKIIVKSKDEIGQLSEAFNYMSSTIANEMAGRERAEAAQRRSQKMDAIGQLTGGIAHDFNNLLGIILGNLELLEELIAVDDKTQKCIQAIEKAGSRAATLTKQLLSFSRSEARHIDTININHAIHEMNEIVTRSVTPEIKVNYKMADDLWLTEIDNGDFCDALLNLCINARDSITGHGSLNIETHNVTLDEEFCMDNLGLRPGEYVDVVVRDTGEGIRNELKERIFEPFFTTKDQGKGTGLGLAMVYAFVKRSNGYVKCDSEVGVGTTFHLYLPKKLDGELAVQQEENEKQRAPYGKETVLVVDDEEALKELAEIILEAQGYRVLTADDGKQALALIEKHPEIDLLFSDIVMPNGLNGYELAEQAIVIRSDLKVLLTTGFARNTDSETIHPEFEENMLNKPYRQNELLNKIRSSLDDV